MPENKMLAAALYYATKLNWPVVPLHEIDEDGNCTCGTRCGSRAKHPRTERGHLDATTDKATIRDWWRTWPNANVGIRVGPEAGLIVVDVDPRNGGDATYRELVEEKGSKWTQTLKAKTGGGGQHLYYKWTDTPIAKHPRGIDIKVNGFVVAAPSMHESGRAYKWAEPPREDSVIRPLPKWARSVKAGESRREKRNFEDFIPLGDRNNAATSYAGALRRAGANEAEIVAALVIFCRTKMQEPLNEREIRSIARSVCRYEPAAADSLKEWTEAEMADQFVSMHGRDFKYIDKTGWFVWDNGRWRANADSEALLRARDVSTHLFDVARATSAEDVKKKLYSRAMAASTARVMREILNLARTDRAIALKSVESFDADPWLFNVQNGTIDLRTGELRRHNRNDLITKMAPVSYDADATAPRFESFIHETFRDAETEAYIQRFFGYCLTGDVREQVFSIFWGGGGNGKSKLIEAIRDTMGNDFITTIPTSAILDTRFDDKFALATLKGRRLALASESTARKTLDEEVIKRITGGDTIRAEEKYKASFEFSPTHKVVLITNHKPRISASESIARRLQLVPFDFKPEQDDKQLGDKLKAEAAGILTWMVEGCLQWQEQGLNPPAKVRSATEAYREAEDYIGQFVHETYTLKTSKSLPITSVYNAYQLWAVTNGVRYLGKIRFNNELAERFPQLEKYRSNGGWRWRGIKKRSPSAK